MVNVAGPGREKVPGVMVECIKFASAWATIDNLGKKKLLTGGEQVLYTNITMNGTQFSLSRHSPCHQHRPDWQTNFHEENGKGVDKIGTIQAQLA